LSLPCAADNESATGAALKASAEAKRAPENSGRGVILLCVGMHA